MCIKCKHRVFFDPVKKELYYIDDDCNRTPLPTGINIGGAPIGGSPSLPPVDPDIPETQSLACYKAIGAWNVIETLADAVFDVYTETSNAVAAAVIIQRRYPDLKLDNWQLYSFGFNSLGNPDYEEISQMWDDNRDAIKADFICYMQDVLYKSQQLTDADLQKIKDYDFDSPEADLDDLLTKMLAVPEQSYWQEQAAYFVQAQEGTCDCTGSEPTAPPADGSEPPPEGCIKVYPPQMAFSAYDGQNLELPLASWLNPTYYFGTIVDGVHTTAPSGNNGEGSDLFQHGAVFAISPGAQILEVRWDWSSPYTQGTGGRAYQFAVYDWTAPGANSHLVNDVTVTGGTGATVTMPVSGTWVARTHIGISMFATASTGNLNQVKMRNVQFHIKSIADGFDGWVSAGQDFCG